jgi:murein DD-endopeptidase MepM/ murein hydrolase activator NlpD
VTKIIHFGRYLLRVATDERFAGNRFSRVLRRVFERRITPRLLGLNLVAVTLVASSTLPGNFNLTNNQPDPRLVARLSQFTTQKTVIRPLVSFDLSQGYSFFHQGADLRVPIGTPVNPIIEGTVKLVQNDRGGYGRHVIIDHGHGFESLYAHLSQVNVQVGEGVTHQTVLGLSGSTGSSTGPHLHLETRENNRSFDPLILLK